MVAQAVSIVVDEVAHLLRKYPHIDKKDCTVAFSGGKDSFVLAHALRENGKNIRLRSVDMGYSAEWAARIREIARQFRFEVEIVSVSNLLESSGLKEEAKRDLNTRQHFLRRLASAPDPNVTPCTNCYNCKILALTQLRTASAEVIYFGHHSDDIVSSFLKSALMYYDRWERQHRVFARENFAELVVEVAADLKLTKSLFMPRFLDYLDQGVASTSEPIYEVKSLHDVSYAIARPLAGIGENLTKLYVEKLGARVESSGCGHTTTFETMTPREIVQHHLLPSVLVEPIGRTNIVTLRKWISRQFKPDGSLECNARANRASILGRFYKDGNDDLHMKY